MQPDSISYNEGTTPYFDSPVDRDIDMKSIATDQDDQMLTLWLLINHRLRVITCHFQLYGLKTLQLD
ncbi:hypothetical protein CCR75_006153 [Bremia lactucae]|uniref:Uncharacterized protein n=1 Tax=Bremia lactucae TaxID=4779 RepID=A0A976FPF9_BRELC|nr:hypothetical protein CCR75_006153 [Bremia lactucae]